MRSFRFLILILLLMSVAGCSEPLPPSTSLEIKNGGSIELSPGVYQRTLATDDGPSIRYTISVPTQIDDSKKLPLVIALHFGGGARGNAPVRPFFGEAILTNLAGPALNDLNAILVAPDSLGGPWTSKTNESAILKLYDHTIEAYRIDENRTLITGFSMGGHGTWYMAARHPERFSAAIPIAGTPDPGFTEWQIPVRALHAPDDPVVPYPPTREYVERIQSLGGDMKLVDIKVPPNTNAHFNMGAYIPSLRQHTSWVQTVWNRRDNHGSD